MFIMTPWSHVSWITDPNIVLHHHVILEVIKMKEFLKIIKGWILVSKLQKSGPSILGPKL
jgi:hypothetical protein